MSDKIAAALTSEEWAEALAHADLSEWDSCVPPDAAGRHYAAALCLHGMEFGFTREDVSRLRGFSGTLSAMTWGAEHAGPTSDLADRIEALLPPEGRNQSVTSRETAAPPESENS